MATPLKFLFWANQKCDAMLWSIWLLQNWHVPKDWISSKLLNRKFESKCEIIQPLTYPVNYQKSIQMNFDNFFFLFMKVHYFMPYVITAYPTLALPKTTSACMGNTIELKFLGQKWVGRKVSSKGGNNNGLCIEEVCGNAFASGVYDKIRAVTMNLIT